MFSTFVVIIHIMVCLALILIILLQTTKGSGMGAAFGGASQTLFGSTGRATFLTKITIAAAVTFCLTAVGLSLMSTTSISVMDDYQPPGPSMPEVPELPPIPEIPGASSAQPGAAPGEAGEDSAIAPLEKQPGLVPPLPEGPIAPPESPSPDGSRGLPGAGDSP